MDPIESVLNRPKAYYNIDGVGELGGGFGLLGFALLGWMQVHTPAESVWHRMYTFVIFMGLMWSIIHYGSKAIKKHITYPRTGFVEYQTRMRWRTMLMAALVSMLLVLFIAPLSHRHLTAPFSLIGLVVAASYARGFARTVRWKWAVVWVMALGSLVIAVLPLPADLVGSLAAYWLYMALCGATLLISGGISFCLYLRHTQPPAQDAQ